jgi:hypothetical protein
VSPLIGTYIIAANLDAEKYVKRLLGLGKTDIQGALQRLDVLTKEEIAMIMASNLRTTSEIYGSVNSDSSGARHTNYS